MENGNNFQITADHKDGKGRVYFGYAETEAEAKEVIWGQFGLALRPDCQHLTNWKITDLRSGKKQ